MTSPLIEFFPALSAIPGLRHGFFLRHHGIDIDGPREEVLERLRPFHDECLAHLGFSRSRIATGEQIHEARVGLVAGRHPASLHFPGTDALISGLPGQSVGVWVADCGAVFLADPVRRICAVAHSGRRGSELGIVTETISRMASCFGSRPGDLVVQLAPCIRPPAYEVDFAARIVADCLAAGVPASAIHDCGTCTSGDLGRYYSYRVEKGRTGRMFAVIGFDAK